MTLAVVAVALALGASAERISSEDGKFSVEVSAPWDVERGLRGRSVELKSREENRVVIAGEWRDGAAPEPAAAQQARLKGAETASLPREGKVPLRYARRPSKRFNRLQGWLTCGGDRYLFDAVVQRDEWLWFVLDTFSCKAEAPAAGMSVGDTGWKIAIPPEFKQIGYSKDGRGMWERDRTRQRGYTLEGDKDTLRIMSGTESWSLSRPWPGTCKFGDAKALTLESPRLQEHRGKNGFLYSCGFPDAPPEQASYAYDLIIDYDAALGQASFISLRMTHWSADGTPMLPDRALFSRVISSLERSRPEPAREAPQPAPAAVPLLR